MDLLLARQPVFDPKDRLMGYALAHSTQLVSAPLGHGSGASSAGRLMVEALLGVGLENLVENKQLLLPADADLLLSEAVLLLPAERTTLLVSAVDIVQTPELSPACERLLWSGYRIALLDLDAELVSHPVTRLADAVLVDVRSHSPESLSALVAQLRPLYVRLFAMNVRHRAERDQCARLGFELFLGHRASRPEKVARRDVPIEHLQAFRLLRLARDSSTSDQELEKMFRRDVALSYKLLRMVNSAGIGIREVWSIGHALRLLGRVTLTRWLTLLLLTDVANDDRMVELSRVATLRGRLCELLGAEAGVPRAGESLYLVGLLSLVDELLEMPVDQVVTLLELAPDVRDALLHRADFYGEVLALVEAYEAGDWSAVEALCASVGVVPTRVAALYLDALKWAGEQKR
jgi:EAL and modified HD-GYP domain-containing signal transduction protein